MRVEAALAFALTVAGCGGARSSGPEPLDEPAEVPASFADYRPGVQGCIFGSCTAGRFARRTGDRTISGVVGDATLQVDWEGGPCAGWSYHGQIVDDQPHGTGVLTPKDRTPFAWISGRFAYGVLVGEAEAPVKLRDATDGTLRAELALDAKTCAVRFVKPDQVTLDPIQIVGAGDQIVETTFRGVIRIHQGVVLPWRGTIAADPTASGYIRYADGGWVVADPEVCLAGDCIDGPGVEHLGGGRFEIFDGEFLHGARKGQGTVYTLDATGFREYSISYNDNGDAEGLRQPRRRYTISGPCDGAVTRFAAGELEVEGLVLGTPLRIKWDPQTGGMVGISDRDDAIPRDIHTRLNLPAKTERVIAAMALLEAELPRGTTPRVQRMQSLGTRGELEYHGITEGRRTLLVGLIADDKVVRQAWLPAWQRLLIGDHLYVDKLGRLTGEARAFASDGTATDVVLYDGVRIDPLKFASIAQYEKTSAATRRARAQKAAKAALAKRVTDDRLVLAYRRIRNGINSGVQLLSTANSAITATASDPATWERVIRNAHAAVEQAQVTIFDATVGADQAIPRVDWSDPCAEPLATLAADLHDLDERLRLLLFAFDAFAYSDDIERLSRIARAFAADLAVLPSTELTARLATLQAAIDGAPQPTPATLAKSPAPTPDEIKARQREKERILYEDLED